METITVPANWHEELRIKGKQSLVTHVKLSYGDTVRFSSPIGETCVSIDCITPVGGIFQYHFSTCIPPHCGPVIKDPALAESFLAGKITIVPKCEIHYHPGSLLVASIRGKHYTALVVETNPESLAIHMPWRKTNISRAELHALLKAKEDDTILFTSLPAGLKVGDKVIVHYPGDLCCNPDTNEIEILAVQSPKTYEVRQC